MNILVTGATGFIGVNLVRELVKSHDNNIICLVRKTSKIKELDSLGASLAYGDISDFDSLLRIPYQIDMLFHCAGHVDNRHRERLRSVNIDGTRNILEYSLRRNIKRVIYTSSVAVTSGNADVPLVEELPYAATNDYGWSKIEAEKIAMEYRAKGMNIVIIRPSMVYGPGEPHMMRYLLSLLRFNLFPLFNGGRQMLHMAYIGNVVDAMIFAMRNDSMLKGTYYIADKEVFTAQEVITYLAQGLNVKPPRPVRPGVERALSSFPAVARGINSFRKDRVYSVSAIEKAGFKFRYKGSDALVSSARDFYRT